MTGGSRANTCCRTERNSTILDRYFQYQYHFISIFHVKFGHSEALLVGFTRHLPVLDGRSRGIPLTSSLQAARYGWYILPSPLTYCPGLTDIFLVGATKTTGTALGYPWGTHIDIGNRYVMPRKLPGSVPARLTRRDDWPFS